MGESSPFHHDQHPAERDRARLFDSVPFSQNFVSTLGALRTHLDFKIVGYVLMPEHVHFLIWPSEKSHPSQILKSLKERTAKFILRNLLESRDHPWCRKDRKPIDFASYGSRRISSPRLAKAILRHEHLDGKETVGKVEVHARQSDADWRAAVVLARHLPLTTHQCSWWPWSSFRFYFLEDASALATDRLP